MLVCVFMFVWNWSAGRSGNVGVVFYATSIDSLNGLIQNGTDPPYIVVMSAQLFEEYAYTQYKYWEW